MTQYIKEEELNSFKIQEVAQAFKLGQLVIFPTDTVYGIGTNVYDGEACERIYEVKGRPHYKPLTVLISNYSMLEELVDSVNLVEQKLIDTFWPNSLTIKFKKKKGVLPEIVSAGDDFIRVRLVSDCLISRLIDVAMVPVVAPSANISDNITGTKIENIVQEFGGKVDYILDSGDIESDLVSTIVEVIDGKVCIIREGKITKKEIEKIAPVIDVE